MESTLQATCHQNESRHKACNLQPMYIYLESLAPNRLGPADLLVRASLEALGLAQEPLLL